MSLNIVVVCGRVTRDPSVQYTSNQMCVARFNIALDRGKDKDGQSKGADYPQIVAFGKVGEVIERFVNKGSQLAIYGHLHTDSYEKDGKKVYTTDVIADRVELMGKAEKTEGKAEKPKQGVPSGFSEEDTSWIPF